MNIFFGNLPENLRVDKEIENICRKTAEKIGELYDEKESEVSITITNDEEIHKLNKKYRNIDRPTDVLSFAFRETDEDVDDSNLGEIIISCERAKAQAEEYGHSLEREIAFLTAHGMLHLLGYDHIEEADRIEMEAEQRFIMNALNISRDDNAKEAAKNLADENFKSGFVAVIGRPNVGKSTLINSLIGQKIAIMSDKPQTTRNKILCVLTENDAQIIFLDTPGIHKPKHKLGEYMVQAAEGTLKDVDAIFFVVDATETFGAGEKYIIERLQSTNRPVMLLINKIDLLEKTDILPVIEKYKNTYEYSAIIPISAKNNENLESLLAEAKKYLPKGPMYYPSDMVTDQPERLIAAELIREKALQLTRDEVPHSIAVEVDEMKTRKKGDIYIRATIYVERESQKGIVIGKRGALLKEIGALSRKDIEIMVGAKVYLDLWVKVKKDWRDVEGAIQSFGLGG